MKPTVYYLLFCALFWGLLNAATYAQDTTTNTADTFGEQLKNTEFGIPVSPAFVMLDATPERIIRPALPRSFKVDWSLRTYSFAPNIALEAQPLWLLLYDKAPLSKYQKANSLLKTLSTISLSAGTTQKDSINNLAWGLKMNVYRSRDPLTDKELTDSLNMLISADEQQMTAELKALRKQMEKLRYKTDAISVKSKDKLQNAIDSIRFELMQFKTQRSELIRELQKNYIQRHWNTSMIDVAFARSYTFDRDVGLDSLNLIGKATGMWINGAVGIGTQWLISGMAQYTLSDATDTYLLGANLRYGNGRYNFFTEAFIQNFTRLPDKNSITFAFGGDFKLSRNVLLNFALRQRFSEKLSFKEIIPIANIICLMR
ncbi:MAG TPA: hypothetical protein PK239_07495 [Chitinophagales bacterium]|nr:hypothetical protein [Chitinophagales bacterium]HRK27119.1 hypothetical protein [Chitinophagales bacterium]